MRYLKGIIVLSVLAFLFVSITSYTAIGSSITSRYSFEKSISYELPRANTAQDVTGFNPGNEYYHKFAVDMTGIEFDFLDSTYRNDSINILPAAAFDDYEAPVRPADHTDLAYVADALNTNPESGMSGEFFAYNANFGTGRYITTDLFNENDKAGGLYYYYVASISPTRPPESSLDEISVSSNSSDDDGAEEAIFEVGDSPLSTHSLFEALSISGTYPDNDVIEIELPTILRLGDKRITVGAGWLLPSGIQIPLGAEKDSSADESAYYLSLIIRF